MTILNRLHNFLVLIIISLLLGACSNGFVLWRINGHNNESLNESLVKYDYSELFAKRQIVIEDNDIHENNKAGLRVRGSTPLVVRRCKIHHNGRAGVRVERQAKILLEDTSLFANGTAGLDVKDVGRVSCFNLKIYQNSEGGIAIWKNGTDHSGKSILRVDGSRIFYNGQAGLRSYPQLPAKVIIRISNSEVFSNKRAGIRVENNSRLVAWNNLIFSNGESGIVALSKGALAPILDVYQSRIFFNDQAGILIQSGNTGVIGIANNWIYNNNKSGINCGVERKTAGIRHIEIYHNTIVANGSNFEGAGIRNDSGAKVEIKNNIVAYNYRTGIMTKSCTSATHNLFFANGDTSGFPENAEYAFLLEKLQYAGCVSNWSSNNILADPLFKDPDKYDFSLSKDSPARGKASPISTSYFRSFKNLDLGSLVIPVDCRPFYGSCNKPNKEGK